MFFVRDKGQMCNNIIQFGHAYGWARENGHRAVSMRFSYKYRYFNICRTAWHNIGIYFIVKLLAAVRIFPDIFYKYRGVDHTQEEQRAIRRTWWPTVISRWFVRHYDEFERHLPEMRQLFALIPELQTVVDDSWKQSGAALSDHVLGLHIRRGDYKKFVGGKFFLSDEEYIAAAHAAMSIHPDARWTIIVCGNDPSLDAELYKRKLSPANVYISHGASWEDLGLFAKCDYLVGVPSSYTLVATMYGHARLHWLTNNKDISEESDFQTFEVRFREFDNCFL